MIYYIYKITLTEGSLKDHYYFGQRKYKGDDISKDLYKGSGDIVKKYYKKYPKSYIKEILEICDSPKSLNDAEIKWIGDKYETDPMCLNLRAGGGGGYISKTVYNRFKTEYLGHPVSEETRKKIGEKNRGRKASEETRQKMSACRRRKKLNVDRSGDKNSNAKTVYQIDEFGNVIKNEAQQKNPQYIIIKQNVLFQTLVENTKDVQDIFEHMLVVLMLKTFSTI